MKKKYITPTAIIVKIETEGMLALSGGDKVTIDNGSAGSDNFTNKKHPIWGEEEESNPLNN